MDRVDALVLPELERRAGGAGPEILEAALAEVVEAQAAHDATVRELDAFLAAALVSELGRDDYAREVVRRRDAARATAAVLRRALDAQDALAVDEGADAVREAAQRLIEDATLAPADPKRRRWQPMDERLALVWRGE